jgi:RNA polymerase sigma-70 factor, ECF subfamily
VAPLLERIARGEKAAFAQCLDQYGDLVWGLSRRMSPNSQDAEDATQEIFFSLWKKAAHYDAMRGSEAVFIATIARRALIDRYRERRRKPLEVLIEEADSLWADGEETRGETGADADRAVQALKRLKPEQQRVITLAIWQGLSQSEIAGMTGMPLGTVKSLIRRGLLSIRESLNGAFKR